MMKKIELFTYLLILLGIVLATEAGAGTGAIPSGPDVKMLKNSIRFKQDNVRIIANDLADPTAVAKTADIGSSYIKKDTGTWYRKTDGGSSTNWQLFIFGALGLGGLDECLPRWDGAGTGVLQDSFLCVTDAGIGTGLTGLFVDGSGHFDDLHVGGTSQSVTAGLTFEVEDVSNNSIFQVTDAGNVVFTSPTPSKPLQLDSSNEVFSGDVNATSDIDGILPVEHGGSGLDASLAANGTFLIGNGTGFDLNVVSGTANQVLTTPSAGGLTLSLPQDIHVGATPTFVSATFSGVLPNEFIKTDGTSGLTSVPSIDLTSDVTGVLPIANGGTNSSTALNNDRMVLSAAGSIVEGSALLDGQFFIGADGGSPLPGTILGTVNQFLVSYTSNSITGSLPQDIHTAASPTFSTATFTSMTASRPLKVDGSNLVISELIDLADSTNDIEGILAIANGGTNSSTALNNNRQMISSGGSIVEADALTAGSVAFADTNGIVEDDNANLFWDNINDTLLIGNNTTDTSASFEVTSTTKGILTSRMTTAQRDLITVNSARDGLLIFNTSAGRFNFYSDTETSWINMVGVAEPTCFIKRIVADTVQGGTAGNQVFVTRLLNTLQGSCAGIAVAAGVVTISVDASFKVRAYAPTFNVGRNFMVIQNTSDTVEEIRGINHGGSVGSHNSTAVLAGELTVAGSPKTYELRHWTENPQATTGLGQSNGIETGVEVYATLELTRIE